MHTGWPTSGKSRGLLFFLQWEYQLDNPLEASNTSIQLKLENGQRVQKLLGRDWQIHRANFNFPGIWLTNKLIFRMQVQINKKLVWHKFTKKK